MRDLVFFFISCKMAFTPVGISTPHRILCFLMLENLNKILLFNHIKAFVDKFTVVSRRLIEWNLNLMEEIN